MTALIASFPRRGEFKYNTPSLFEAHKHRWLWHFGKDAYWTFLDRKRCFPKPAEAEGLGALLGCKVRASDGKYYGCGVNPLYLRRVK
jgi:hypothetical protein